MGSDAVPTTRSALALVCGAAIVAAIGAVFMVAARLPHHPPSPMPAADYVERAGVHMV